MLGKSIIQIIYFLIVIHLQFTTRSGVLSIILWGDFHELHFDHILQFA